MSDHTPRRTILAEHQIDHVANAVIALTREVWVLSDRQVMLERLLAGNGIDVSALETAQPDEEAQAELTRRRDTLIDRVVTALKGG